MSVLAKSGNLLFRQDLCLDIKTTLLVCFICLALSINTFIGGFVHATTSLCIDITSVNQWTKTKFLKYISVTKQNK